MTPEEIKARAKKYNHGLNFLHYLQLWQRACAIQDEAFWEGNKIGFNWACEDIRRYEEMMEVFNV